VPASERLSAAILERRLKHPGDPVLDAHVHAAVAKQTERGARIAHAGGRHTSQRIDGAIALALALSALEEQPEPVEFSGGCSTSLPRLRPPHRVGKPLPGVSAPAPTR